MHSSLRRASAAVAAAVVLLVAACGDDDGATVRAIGSGSASGSASASGSGSGSGSGSATGVSGSAATADAGEDGGYEYASDVSAHRLVVLDVCDVNELLDADEIDFEAIAAVYDEGGRSVNADGSVRTLAGFATATDRNHGLDDYYGTPSPLDDFVTSAIEGTGPFDGESDAVRRQGVQKGLQNQVMVAWVVHELNSALAKAADGDFDAEGGAPHNWDEAWAFYHGAAPDCGPFATATKRAGDFGTLADDGETALANAAILDAMIQGRDALLAGDRDGAQAAADEIVRNIVVTYAQATIRYATVIADDLASGDVDGARVHQAEGLAFFRVIEAIVAEAGADVDTVLGVLALDNEPGAGGDGEDVRAALQPALDALGIDDSDIGEL